MLLLPLVLLGGLEVSLRLGGYGYKPDFFKRVKIGGEEFFVQNEDFSLRFFPKEVVRNPGPVRFPVHKAPGTFRIFILGESAAMGDPAQSFAPSRYLEMLLREKYQDRKFEVLNLAFTAINSHVIVPIARECAEHEGDLWIIYMGNNEMVGPFGAATVFGRQAPPLPYARLVTALQRLRTGQWFMALGRKLTARKEQARAWGGMGMFLHNQIAPDSPLKETVYHNFKSNLHDIVRTGVDSGAKVLLNTVAVNLKDCPPFASITNVNLTPADRVQADTFYASALKTQAQADFAAAAELFQRGARLDTNSADLQFHWGGCSLAQSNLAGAQEHFQLSCDYDALPFRADSRINAAIRAEREQVKGEKLILFDAANGLAASGGVPVCGEETFFEHVHFDFDGRYRLARAWAEQTEPLLPRSTNGWISQAACEQMLGLSPWNRAQVIHFIVERMQMAPLNGQANNDRRRDALEARITQLRTQMNPANAAKERSAFLKLVDQRPDDFFLLQEYGVFLELTGNLEAAAKEWQRYCALVPQDFLGYYEVGRMLNAEQRYSEAETSLRIATGIRPGRTDAWVELGSALLFQKMYSEALACYSTAQKQDPRNPQLLVYRGKALSALNRHAEAQESFRSAIQLDPADGLAHHELAVELVAAWQPAAAGWELAEAARLSPDKAVARLDYGMWLMKQEHWAAAQQEFEAVLRLEPGNTQARQNLAWLRAGRPQGP